MSIVRTIVRTIASATVLSLVFGISLFGCATDAPPTASYDANTALWNIALDQHAVTLSTVAPYDTVHLTGHAVSAALTPLADVPVVMTSPDSAITVTPDGFVTAKFSQVGAVIITSVTQGTLTIYDTIVVNVTDEPHPQHPVRLELTTTGEDSIFQFANFDDFTKSFKGYVLAAYDANGDSIPGAAYHIKSSDTVAVQINPFGLSGLFLMNLTAPEHLAISADATIYGVALHDTMPMILTYPARGFMSVTTIVPKGRTTPVAIFSPDSITVTPGATVGWANPTTTPIDVVFDDSTAVASDPTAPTGSGNIPAFQADTVAAQRSRTFPQAGVYRFHSKLQGSSGVVVVKNFQ